MFDGQHIEAECARCHRVRPLLAGRCVVCGTPSSAVPDPAPPPTWRWLVHPLVQLAFVWLVTAGCLVGVDGLWEPTRPPWRVAPAGPLAVGVALFSAAYLGAGAWLPGVATPRRPGLLRVQTEVPWMAPADRGAMFHQPTSGYVACGRTALALACVAAVLALSAFFAG